MDKAAEIADVYRQTAEAVNELLVVAAAKPGMILVVGCSTSEVRGQRIGSAGSRTVAESIIGALLAVCQERGIHVAVQCCEHLNRALVVEREVQERRNLEEVSVIPIQHAGGALATEAYYRFSDPVLVENIEAHLGLDIGNTLIGMHMRPVAIPVRLLHNEVGQAQLTAARSRPKLIGGARACYELPPTPQCE